MSGIEQKRRFVSDLYPGQDWKDRVMQMPEYQIIAIYLRTKDNQEPKPSKEENKDGPPEPPPLTLF